MNKRHLPDDEFPPIPQTNLHTCYFATNDCDLLFEEFRSIKLYNRLIRKNITTHQHALIYNSLDIQPEWHSLPNKRIHPALSYFTKELRFKTIHNRHYIGRQRAHLPDITEGVEFFPRCHIENNVLHLFLDCSEVSQAWLLIQLQWEILTQSYKDELGTLNLDVEDFELDQFTILPHHKLFGVPTPSRSNQTFNSFIL